MQISSVVSSVAATIRAVARAPPARILLIHSTISTHVPRSTALGVFRAYQLFLDSSASSERTCSPRELGRAESSIRAPVFSLYSQGSRKRWYRQPPRRTRVARRSTRPKPPPRRRVLTRSTMRQSSSNSDTRVAVAAAARSVVTRVTALVRNPVPVVPNRRSPSIRPLLHRHPYQAPPTVLPAQPASSISSINRTSSRARSSVLTRGAAAAAAADPHTHRCVVRIHPPRPPCRRPSLRSPFSPPPFVCSSTRAPRIGRPHSARCTSSIARSTGTPSDSCSLRRRTAANRPCAPSASTRRSRPRSRGAATPFATRAWCTTCRSPISTGAAARCALSRCASTTCARCSGCRRRRPLSLWPPLDISRAQRPLQSPCRLCLPLPMATPRHFRQSPPMRLQSASATA
jgi:hypothetical protein